MRVCSGFGKLNGNKAAMSFFRVFMSYSARPSPYNARRFLHVSKEMETFQRTGSKETFLFYIMKKTNLLNFCHNYLQFPPVYRKDKHQFSNLTDIALHPCDSIPLFVKYRQRLWSGMVVGYHIIQKFPHLLSAAVRKFPNVKKNWDKDFLLPHDSRLLFVRAEFCPTAETWTSSSWSSQHHTHTKRERERTTHIYFLAHAYNSEAKPRK